MTFSLNTDPQHLLHSHVSHQKRSSHYKTKICKVSLVAAAALNVCCRSYTLQTLAWNIGSCASFRAPKCCSGSLCCVLRPKFCLASTEPQWAKHFWPDWDLITHQKEHFLILAGFIPSTSVISDFESQQSRCFAKFWSIDPQVCFLSSRKRSMCQEFKVLAFWYTHALISRQTIFSCVSLRCLNQV